MIEELEDDVVFFFSQTKIAVQPGEYEEWVTGRSLVVTKCASPFPRVQFVYNVDYVDPASKAYEKGMRYGMQIIGIDPSFRILHVALTKQFYDGVEAEAKAEAEAEAEAKAETGSAVEDLLNFTRLNFMA